MIKKVCVKIEQDNINDDTSNFPVYKCPKCDKGIVTIGLVPFVVFPSGILASNKIGRIRLYHFTCERCDFKVLTNGISEIFKDT